MKRLVATVSTAAMLGSGFALASAAPAFADDRICRGFIGQRVIDGNVIVPKGADCTLQGTTVKGNVIVRAYADVDIHRANIDGNIQSWGARIRVRASTIDGDYQAKGGPSVNFVRYNTFGGNIQTEEGVKYLQATHNEVDGNIQHVKSRNAEILSNRVNGDVQVFENRNTVLKISWNRIKGNLQCKSNYPRPTGGNNTVAGDKEGQCYRF